MCVTGRQEEGGRCAVTHTLEYIEYMALEQSN